MDSNRWSQVKEIFYAALDLPQAERRVFLRGKCDDDLLYEEIESLLEAHEEAERFIEAPAFASVKDFIKDEKESSLIGKLISVYRIEKEIGRGGMGAVYLASRADEQFEKRVAIKLIKRGLDTDDIIRRFRHERQILAALDHPNITRLLDGGATDDGLPYLVMDYVEGKPLTKYAEENSLSVNGRLKIFLQICEAVQYAHQNLIIHRDIKPSNIFVTTDGVPKLLDFGIAKLIAPDAAQTYERTATQIMTPEYASPEQISGQLVTTSTDIYSLGVLLYELLTGQKPFKTKSSNPFEVTRLITASEPRKPSSVIKKEREKKRKGEREKVTKDFSISPSPFLPFSPSDLRGDLDNIILMAIRKEPERRYSSVEQFAADINRHLKGLPVMARQDTFSYRASKFIGRHKAAVAAGAGIVTALIAGLVATKRQARIAQRQRDKAENINQFLQKMLASADPRVVGKDVKLVEVLGIAAQSIESDFANQPEIAADLETTLGLTYLSLGQFESAEKYLKPALDTRLALFPRRSVEVAMSLNNYGKLLQARGDLNAAEPLYAEALDTLRRLPDDSSLKVAEVLDNLGYLVAMKGENKEAVSLHEEELAIRRRILGENHPEVARTLGKLANVWIVLGKTEIAEPLHRQALKILQKSHNREHPDIALSMLNLAAAIHSKHPEEAEQLCRQSLSMRRKLLGEDHTETAWSLYNLAYILLNRRKYGEAEQYLREALAKRGASLPDEHPVVAGCLLLWGRILMMQNKFGAAKSAFEECFDLRQKTLPEGHWLLATTKSFLGESLIYIGETAKGRRMMQENYEVLKEKLGMEHEQTRNALERITKFRNSL